MRLFIATDLDAAAREGISALQWRLDRQLAARSSSKWTKPEQMHLTLVFIGEADERLSAALLVAMARPSARAAFDVTFEGIGTFPPRGAPRVLWLGVGDGAARIADLQAEMAARVEGAGVALERRPFHPHLTLARWRDGRLGDRRAVEQAATGGVVARARIDHATLYRSQPGPAGSVYTPLARVTLHP